MEYQFRRYRVAPGKLGEFVAAWEEKVVPLRRALGFEVIAAYAMSETDEFVWILGFDGDLAAADAAYYGSPLRTALDPNPTDLIIHAEEAPARRVV